MTDPATTTSLPPGVEEWIAETVGPVQGAEVLAGGNRHSTFAVQVDGPHGVDELVVRWSTEKPDADGLTPLQREEQACRAVAGTGVPAPAVLASDHELGAVLVERIDGVPNLTGATADEADEIARQLGRHLATLHDLDVDRLDLGGLGQDGDMGSLVLRTIDRLEDRYRATGRPDELIALALSWCRQEAPVDPSPPCLVHGDAGPGNVLVRDGRVVALVDWELAHLGDPHEDLAALAMRTTHGRMGSFAELVGAWTTARDGAFDAGRYAHQQVLAALNIAVMRHEATETTPDHAVARRLLSEALHRRLLVDALCRALDVPFPEHFELDAGGGSHDEPTAHLYEVVLQELRHDVLPAVRRDQDALDATKDIARIVKFLENVSLHGPVVEQEQLQALSPLATPRAHGLEQVRAAVASAVLEGELDVATALPAVATAEAARTALLRSAMGSLADQRLPQPHRWRADELRPGRDRNRPEGR